jgi:hypothetical protein
MSADTVSPRSTPVASVKHSLLHSAVVSVGFAPSKKDPLTRLRTAYRLCAKATANLERCRAERRPREKADHFARAVVNVREIQTEIEAVGVRLKECLIIEPDLEDEIS